MRHDGGMGFRLLGYPQGTDPGFQENITARATPLLPPGTGSYEMRLNPNVATTSDVADAYYGGGVPGPSFVPTGDQTAPDFREIAPAPGFYSTENPNAWPLPPGTGGSERKLGIPDESLLRQLDRDIAQMQPTPPAQGGGVESDTAIALDDVARAFVDLVSGEAPALKIRRYIRENRASLERSAAALPTGIIRRLLNLYEAQAGVKRNRGMEGDIPSWVLDPRFKGYYNPDQLNPFFNPHDIEVAGGGYVGRGMRHGGIMSIRRR